MYMYCINMCIYIHSFKYVYFFMNIIFVPFNPSDYKPAPVLAVPTAALGSSVPPP